MNKPYFCRIFFLTDWRYKRLKNTIDLLLFCGEHFYGFSESVTVSDNNQIQLKKKYLLSRKSAPRWGK